MDTDRQLRFAVAPLFLYGSLLAGALWSGVVDTGTPHALGNEALAAIAAIGLAATLPLGFLIGGISLLCLRAYSWASGLTSHEVRFTEEVRATVGTLVGVTLDNTGKDDLHAAALFDHELMSEGAHEWIMRRWTAYSINMNATTALVVAFIAGPLLGIPLSLGWLLAGVAVAIPLLFNAHFAWRETMEMFAMQADRGKASVVPRTR